MKHLRGQGVILLHLGSDDLADVRDRLTMYPVSRGALDEAWPLATAPYQTIVIPTNTADEQINAVAEDIHSRLLEAGVEVLIDDRAERPGVKFKDADLIGIPLRVTVGRKAAEGIVEYKERAGGVVVELTADEAVAKIIEQVKALR